MFFFARCVFWLGIVAWQLPWPPLLPETPGAAPQPLGQALGSVAAEVCLANPDRCLTLAKAAVLPAPGTRLRSSPRLLVTSLPAHGKAVASPRSTDSLTRSDLEPPWTPPRG